MNDSSILTGLSSIVNRKKINMKLDLDAVEDDLKKLEIQDFDSSSDEDEFAEFDTDNSNAKNPDFDLPENENYQSESLENYTDQNSPNQTSPNKNLENTITDDNYYKNLTPPDMPEIHIENQSKKSNFRTAPKPFTETPTYSPEYSGGYSGVPSRSSGNNSNFASASGGFAGFSTHNSVLNDGVYMGEPEEKEEEKEKMLADIDELREELESDDINLTRVPEVDLNSSYHEVIRVYNTLRRKYNRSRCEDMGNGIIMAGARMLEMFFDGKKKYFGFNPDMTGWHRTVRAKMRRMGYERSVIVSGVMDQYKIGPIQRMMLELVPSAFLYSMTRREQHGQKNYNPDMSGDRTQALDELREFD